MKSKVMNVASCLALVASTALRASNAGAAPPTPQPGDYFGIISKTQALLTGGLVADLGDPDVQAKIDGLNASASALSASMRPLSAQQGTPSQAGPLPTATGALWDDLPYTSAADNNFMAQSYARLINMALAVKTPCAGRPICHNSDAAMIAQITDAIDSMSVNWYNANFSHPWGSWFTQEISLPSLLGQLLVLMYDDISWANKQKYIAAVKYDLLHSIASPSTDHFNGYRDAEGANRALEAMNFLLYGMLTKDNAKMSMARTGADSLCQYASANGFFPDGSYIEHKLAGVSGYAYNGGYAIGYYVSLVQMLYLFDASAPWPNTNANLQNLTRFALDSFVPMIYKGAFHPLSEGRDMARESSQDRSVAHNAMRALGMGADFADAANAAYIKSQIKSWIQADPIGYYSDPLVSVFETAKSKAIVADAGVVPGGDQIYMNPFNEMYKTVSNNPGYSFGISMFGPNHYNYESFSGNNRKGWHTSDGMTYLYTANDPTQYTDDFWPTVNMYRLPGTTVDSNTTQPTEKFNLDSWVGGMLSYDFRNGVTGMYLKSSDSLTIEAKKSWIMFNGQIVALGAGVTSADQTNVETIVENRKLNSVGDNAFYVNDQQQPTTLGWSQALANVSTMFLQGNAAASDIGYYFPVPVTLTASRTARTGSWQDINVSGSTDPRTRNYLEIWLDHGFNPVNSTYAYVIVPNTTRAGLASRVASSPVAVLRNDVFAQAAYDPSSTSLGANFWDDAIHPVDLFGALIQVDKKASLFLRNTQVGSKRYTEIGISDPTKLGGLIKVELGIPATAVSYKGAEFTGIPTLPTTSMKFTVDVSGSRGATHFIKFRQN